MIVDTYRKEGRVYKRFVRRALLCNDLYQWCEQSEDNTAFDIAQGTCRGEDLPEDIKKTCDEYEGAFYACEWPLEDKEK